MKSAIVCISSAWPQVTRVIVQLLNFGIVCIWIFLCAIFFRNIATMLIQKSSSISTVVPFSSSAIDNLWYGGQELNSSSIAGVSTGKISVTHVCLVFLLCGCRIAVQFTGLTKNSYQLRKTATSIADSSTLLYHVTQRSDDTRTNARRMHMLLAGTERTHKQCGPAIIIWRMVIWKARIYSQSAMTLTLYLIVWHNDCVLKDDLREILKFL